ncbi:MAG: sigma 54-interacting transcriptional regulator [Chitinivibrionales bacterium]
MPDTLLEAELFGYKAGAFTDAKKDKPGKFALAEGGTLFLDEIGDVSPVVKAKLLRVLQEKTFEPLGATKPVMANVRIVAATNRNLMELIKKGEFREDLFYRINVLSIKLPPLRERRGDIPLLCSHFIGIFNTRYEKEVKQISKNALDLLIAYDFPGNIRELENIMEHAFVFCKGAAILADHLPEEFRQVSPSAGGLSAFNGIDDFEKLEKMYLENILKQTGNNKLQAAERLGINRSTLFRKMKELGIS